MLHRFPSTTQLPQLIGTRLAEMAFGAPDPVLRALREALDEAQLGYLSAEDIIRLGHVSADWLHEEYAWKIDAEAIRPVVDLVAGFHAVLNHFVPEGAPIIVPTPAYMPFLSLPRAMDRPIIEVPMLRGQEEPSIANTSTAGAGWRYDFAGIEAAFAAGAKLLVLCNPHNPIGKVATEAELAELEAIVTRYDGLVFADEVHAPLLLGTAPHLVYAARSERAAAHTITATSASKAFNIPATKCGQLVFTNPEHLAQWQRVGSWYEHHSSKLGVIATEAAYREGKPWLNEVIDYTRQTISEALMLLASSPVRVVPPEATYLLWLDLTDTELAADDRSPAATLRERAGLIATDGAECGAVGANCIRFNGALPREHVLEAMRRLRSAVQAG